MRIGVIVDNDFYHDIRVKRQVRILRNAGHELFVLCFKIKGKPTTSFKEAGIQVKGIEVSQKWVDKIRPLMNILPFYERFWISAVKEFIKERQVEVLHVHDLYMAKSGFLGKKDFDIPMVLDLHENYPAAVLSYNWAIKFPNRLVTLPTKWQKKEEQYLKYADKIITLSNTYSEDLIQRYDFLKESDFFVFPNVPDIAYLENFPIKTEIIKKEVTDLPILFYFGVVAERRGVFELLEAVEQLLKQDIYLKLMLIGPVDNRDSLKFKTIIENEKLKDYIIYHPWIDISLLPTYLKLSTICICPIVKNEQHESGIANKVFQYMLFEKPVIASNCKPQEALIKRHNCGLIYKSGDVLDLKTQIITILSDEKAHKEMGQRGRRAVTEKYNTRILGEEFLKFYEVVGRGVLT